MLSKEVCLVCNKNRFKVKWKAKKHHPTYYSCMNCGLVFAHPQVEKNAKRASMRPFTKDEYDARFKNFELRYKKIERYLPNKSPKVLDIGCYDCVFLNYMKEKGCQVLGVEPASECVRYGKENFGLDIINGFFEDQNIEQKYDLITMFNVLEHAKRPKETLVKTHSLLEKDGLLVLELPYIYTPQSFLSFGFWHHFEIDHNWFFSKNAIKCLLEKVGFQVISISFIPKVVCLSRLLDGLLTRTAYMYIKRDTYLKFRSSSFYRFLNKAEIKINIMDYLFVIAKKLAHN